MNRRSFFRKLAGAAASVAVAASVQCFGIADKIKPLKAIVNPAYATAGYEVVIFFSSGLVKVLDTRMPRYNLKDGKWIQVPLFKEDVS